MWVDGLELTQDKKGGQITSWQNIILSGVMRNAKGVKSAFDSYGVFAVYILSLWPARCA
jgi:hypothetical protein